MSETPPTRGGQVEAWLKGWRDRQDSKANPDRWLALNDALDDLRDRSDYGYGWSAQLDWSAGHPVLIEDDA